MESKRRKFLMRVLFLSAIFLSSIIFSNNSFLNYEINNSLDKNNYDFIDEEKLSPFYSSSTEYSGVGTHQNATEFGQGFFQNNDINLTNFENASIIVPNKWEAEEIQSDVVNIYEYDKLWMNYTFDSSDITGWTNTSTGNYENYSFGWYNDPIGSNDSIYMTLNGSGAFWKDKDAFVNYTFYLDRDEIPYRDWAIKFNYRFITNQTNDWLNNMDAGSKILCRIKVGSITQDFNLGKPDQKVNNTWYSSAIEPFSPELYSYDPPGTVSVLFGLACRGNINLVTTGSLTAYFDNITLKLQTIPRPTQINLSITDETNGNTKQFIDSGGYGLGTVSFQDSWIGDVGGKTHNFSFSSNSSGKVYINTDFYVNATSSTYTTTEIGSQGSEFTVENNTKTTWTMYFPVSVPGSYSPNYYFNVTKPINWNVTHLIDPYSNDKINDISATAGLGNSTLIIPSNIITNGIWKIVAEAPNYVLNGTVWKWNSSNWQKNASLEISDVIKINCTIYNELIPDLSQTNASLTIYYPNGNIWTEASQNISVQSNGYIEFLNFTLGAENATAGQYTVNVKWNNVKISQVGFLALKFNVTHDTSLKRANDQVAIITPIFSGESVLIKVNYTDINTGIGILGATLNYTIDNTTKITGDLIYFGGGIYVAEIDTTGWTRGIYNVSVSANKLYYKSQYQAKLIQMEITESTSIYSPQMGGLNIPWGPNVTIDLSYNGSIGQGIPNATIDCDWVPNYYYVKYVNLGNYEIIINTTIKSKGTYLLKINASKVGYENQDFYISITIRNRFTNLTYLQPDPVSYNENITVQLNYGDLDELGLISGAEITISDDIETQYWNKNDYFYFEPSPGTYNVTFNSTIFGGAGVFQIYFTANKTNFGNATTLINIFIEDISTYIDVFLNGANKTIDKSIKLNLNQTLNITVLYKDTLLKNHISGATVQATGGTISEILNETIALDHYNVTLNATQFDQGVNFLTIYVQKSGYNPQSILITVEIIERETEIEIILNGKSQTEPYLIDLAIGQDLNITFKYKDKEYGHISGAIIELFGDIPSVNLTEAGQQYSTVIDTENLGIGVSFLTLLAQKTNYEPKTAKLRVDVRRINTKITTEDGETTYNARPGESFTITIILKDLDFGGDISGADVTFTSNIAREDLKGGVLEETDEEGVYEVTLENLPENSNENEPYTIFILVIAEDKYYFELFEIKLNVERPQEETLLFQILTVVFIAVAIGLGSYLMLYQKVLKYPKTVRKVRKIRKNLKKKEFPKIDIIDRGSTIDALFEEELGKHAKLLKGETIDSKIVTDKEIDKSPIKTPKTSQIKKQNRN